MINFQSGRCPQLCSVQLVFGNCAHGAAHSAHVTQCAHGALCDRAHEIPQCGNGGLGALCESRLVDAPATSKLPRRPSLRLVSDIVVKSPTEDLEIQLTQPVRMQLSLSMVAQLIGGWREEDMGEKEDGKRIGR